MQTICIIIRNYKISMPSFHTLKSPNSPYFLLQAAAAPTSPKLSTEIKVSIVVAKICRTDRKQIQIPNYSNK